MAIAVLVNGRPTNQLTNGTGSIRPPTQGGGPKLDMGRKPEIQNFAKIMPGIDPFGLVRRNHN